MPATRGPWDPKQFDVDARRRPQLPGALETTSEHEGCAHRPDSVGAGRADPDREQVEDAVAHGLTLSGRDATPDACMGARKTPLSGEGAKGGSDTRAPGGREVAGRCLPALSLDLRASPPVGWLAPSVQDAQRLLSRVASPERSWVPERFWGVLLLRRLGTDGAEDSPEPVRTAVYVTVAGRYARQASRSRSAGGLVWLSIQVRGRRSRASKPRAPRPGHPRAVGRTSIPRPPVAPVSRSPTDERQRVDTCPGVW